MIVSVTLLVVFVLAIVFLYANKIAAALKHRKALSKLPLLPEKHYPLIGHSYLFVGSPKEYFETVMRLTYKFYNEKNAKLGNAWLGITPVVTVFHPDSAEILLKSSKHTTKSFVYDFLHPWLGTGLLTSHGEKWKQRRRLITPSFHFSILQDFLDVMNEQSQIFVRNFQHQLESKQPLNVGRAITMCALDIICETAMGHTVNSQENIDSDYVKALYRMTDLVQLRQKTPYLWWDFAFKKMKMGKEHDQVLNTLHSFTRGVIQERMKTKDSKSNVSRRMAFLDVLIHAKTEDGQELSLNDIQEEVDTFMFEGHDTTAAAMTWATYLIGRHPEVQQRIHEELDEVFGEDRNRPCTMDDLRKLQYLEKVIKESLRLFPSVPFIARVTTDDCEIDGYRIPKGTEVTVNIVFIQRHPDVWEDPEKFDPERFNPETSSKRHPYAYIPFSAGPRNCIGQRFALLEEKVMLSQMLRHFNVTSHDKREDLEIIGDLILKSAKPLDISLTVKP